MGGCKKNCVTTIGIEELRTDGNRQDHHGQLLANCKKPEDMIGKDGLPKELTKVVLERAAASRADRSSGIQKHDSSEGITAVTRAAG
jgi:hypothetical protein